MAPERPAFEIGFVLAGAISAGCYSAGAMDFIIEALDDYYAERDKPGWDGPNHDVYVPVLAGASAGGMTAGMAALHMFKPISHVWPGVAPPPKGENRLYASWVTDISIARLLETKDLEGTVDGLSSVLCSNVLDEILANAFNIDGPTLRRPWVGRANGPALQVMMTLTNLRGVPYSFSLTGADPRDAFGMLNHADVGAFRLSAVDPADGAPYLDVGSTGAPNWGFFKAAALATGAFPVGLKPRAIERLASELRTISTVGTVDAAGRFVIIPPDSRFPADGPFKYWAVDGGTINNEPLEQARRFLTGGGTEKPDGIVADKAVVLVAPFPNYQVYENDRTIGTLASVLPSLASALINQARFKPEELAKARNETNFARFIISPERTNANGPAPKYPIASGALGGFSGFLDQSFRRHDYLLGRRNAQAFLRWNFGLPRSHAIFGGRELPADWIVREASQVTKTLAPEDDRTLEAKKFVLRQGANDKEIGYPIIPLTKRMMQPIEIPAGEIPRPSRDIVEPLRPAIRKRVEKVTDILVDVDLAELTSGLGVFSWIAKKGAKMYGTEVLNNKTTNMIGEALDALRESFPDDGPAKASPALSGSEPGR
ncbi:patatin-like phospholipase family protein [Bradyrhizobium uaiense]|uniref:Patatin n=1 Tax=Bradyrhizobium uaiense TaxID=2594946 RepID=A0A6P1BP15_9BRAD|nr:patatin-like phospholipase family protein [Bradyrhizobium uaiense]NEV00099.1 patatin [Bradyrhizobium uaiense]